MRPPCRAAPPAARRRAVSAATADARPQTCAWCDPGAGGHSSSHRQPPCQCCASCRMRALGGQRGELRGIPSASAVQQDRQNKGRREALLAPQAFGDSAAPQTQLHHETFCTFAKQHPVHGRHRHSRPRARLDGGDDCHFVHLLQVLLHAAALHLEHVLVRRPQLKRLQRARQPAARPPPRSAPPHPPYARLTGLQRAGQPAARLLPCSAPPPPP